LYLALCSFVLATVLFGLDFAGLRFAHGAGVTANILLLVSLMFLVIKGLSSYRHPETGRHSHS
jgi:hypothetical protein